MAQLGVAYDPRNYDPDDRPEPFPEGRVRFMVIATDVRRTRGGDGSFLWIEHQVQGGPNDGRKFWNQITLENPNIQAVEIGQKQLSALCHAVNYLAPLQDSETLHGRSGEADIGIEPAGVDKKTGKSFPAKNVVRKYIVPGEATRPQSSVPQQQQAAAQSNGGAQRKPWEKR